jgi:uncharacterized protein (TIGR00251 family)
MAIVLEFKVIPNSKNQGFEQDSGGRLKCRIKSKPEGGKANEELVKFLGKRLGVSCDDIKILRGATSRNKVIKVDTQISLQDAYFKLGVEVQDKL